MKPARLACPLCLRTLPKPPREIIAHRICWACRIPFTQVGAGRARITCSPACAKKRRTYRRHGLLDLDLFP